MRRARLFLLTAGLGACTFVPVTEKECDDLVACGSGWRCVAGVCLPPLQGAGGGAGGGGGTGGGSTVCGGCRDATGQCFPGGENAHCGAGGQQCAVCGPGLMCTEAACVAASCTAKNCSGCCIGTTCLEPEFQTASNCGAGAKACVGCMGAGQVCKKGVCVTPCSPTTCFSGCCDGDTCVAFAAQSASKCGNLGAACVACGGATPSCKLGGCL